MFGFGEIPATSAVGFKRICQNKKKNIFKYNCNTQSVARRNCKSALCLSQEENNDAAFTNIESPPKSDIGVACDRIPQESREKEDWRGQVSTSAPKKTRQLPWGNFAIGERFVLRFFY